MNKNVYVLLKALKSNIQLISFDQIMIMGMILKGFVFQLSIHSLGIVGLFLSFFLGLFFVLR